jgi:hypothetical protein
MHFQSLTADFDSGSILDASVADDVFASASVRWEKLPRAETAFVLRLLTEAVDLWSGDTAQGVLELRATSLQGEIGYTAKLGDAELPSWPNLDSGKRTSILTNLDEILGLVHGILIIS